MTKVIVEEFPESIVADTLIIVRRNSNNLATVNLDQRTVDCQDEYMRMRLYGIVDQYMGDFNEISD
jgi:hypothetical protein